MVRSLESSYQSLRWHSEQSLSTLLCYDCRRESTPIRKGLSSYCVGENLPSATGAVLGIPAFDSEVYAGTKSRFHRPAAHKVRALGCCNQVRQIVVARDMNSASSFMRFLQTSIGNTAWSACLRQRKSQRQSQRNVSVVAAQLRFASCKPARQYEDYARSHSNDSL